MSLTLPQLSLSIGGLSRSSGSAEFAYGASRVLASLHGPTEVRLRDEDVLKAALEVNWKPLSGLPGPSSRFLINTVRSALADSLDLGSAPRSLLQVTLQTLSGTAISTQVATSITAASLACLDGAFPMRGLVIAVSIAVSANGELTSFPDAKQEAMAASQHAVLVCQGEIVGVESWGDGAEEEWVEIWEQGRELGTKVEDWLRQELHRQWQTR